MTYNSNHIEGPKLTGDQTRLMLETITIDASERIPVVYIIETSNHFRTIDYIIDKSLEPLSEDIIKHDYHYMENSLKDFKKLEPEINVSKGLFNKDIKEHIEFIK
jgi:Fic family protein